MHAVSLTLDARFMRCHLHRIHDACGVSYTASTVHAVSLTPHEKYGTACTIDERFGRLWQTLKEISRKTHMFANWPTHSLQKYINLKGLPNKKRSCMLCHWHRLHDFWVRKSILSRRVRSRVQKGFSRWVIKAQRYCLMKNPKVKNLVTLSL
jgi:hypothetical protein